MYAVGEEKRKTEKWKVVFCFFFFSFLPFRLKWLMLKGQEATSKCELVPGRKDHHHGPLMKSQGSSGDPLSVNPYIQIPILYKSSSISQLQFIH